MSAGHFIRKPVQWYDGMLLRPEHFQYTDRRRDHLSQFYFLNAGYFNWGVIKIQHDPALLTGGTYRVLALEAVFPDGFPFTYDETEGTPLEIDLKAVLTAENPVVTVYLVLPKYLPGAANMAGTFPRYRSIDSGPIFNENTGEETAPFPCLNPNVSLMAGETPPSQYISIPLVRLKGDGKTVIVDAFTPPLVTVSRDSLIGQACMAMALKIRSKITFLAERTRADVTAFTMQEHQSLMQSMAAALLPFEALLRIEQAHPFDLYKELCALAGHLNGIIRNQIPPVFQGYDHNNALKSFEEILHYLDLLLERVQEGYEIIQFQKADRLFFLMMQPDWLQGRLIFGLKTPLGGSPKDMVSWLQSAVIASESTVEGAREKRILGLKRLVVESAEDLKLFPSLDTVLFEVGPDPMFLKQNEALQIFNVGDRPENRPKEILFYRTKQNAAK